MHHRISPTHADRLWTIRGIVLVLAAFVAACDGQWVTPASPTPTPMLTQTQTLVLTPGSLQVPSEIPATGGATNIGGVFQLTVTASPSCSLPAEVMQRTFTATIAETTPGYVTVSLSGAEFVLQEWNQAGFEGIRNGNTLRFVVDNTYGPGYFFIERIDGTKNLVYEGVTLASIGDRNIEGTFYGEMRYFVVGQRPWLGDCLASDHRMTFVR